MVVQRILPNMVDVTTLYISNICEQKEEPEEKNSNFFGNSISLRNKTFLTWLKHVRQ